MDVSALERIGLSPSEAKAYLACLELGPSSGAEVAKHAGLNRSNCYDALTRLIKKGLIASIKREKRTFFEAAEPKRLFELLKKRQEEIAKFVPELEKRRRLVRRPPQIATVYEGYEGIKAVFEDILNTLKPGDEYRVFGAVDVPKVFERYILHWTRRRAEQKIKLEIIYHEEAKSFIEQTKKLPLTEMKVLPKTYITPAAVNIYGNKTATIVWTEKPIALVVKSKEYTDSFRSYFQLLWKIAKPA